VLGLPGQNRPHEPLSTNRRQPGIILNVRLSLIGHLKFRNPNFLSSDRMDNLLKVHS